MAESKKQRRAAPSPPASGTFVASRARGRSALEGCLDGLFTAYARHFLAGEHPLPRFEAKLEGDTVRLEVQAPDGPQLVRRRASAYLLLAGDLWGACRTAEERAVLPALVGSLSSRPQGDGNIWINASAFAADAETARALVALAGLLADEAPAEAVLLLRRFLDVDGGASAHVALLDRVPPSLRAKIVAPSAAGELALRAGGGGALALAKALRPHASSALATERLAAVTCLLAVVHRVDNADNLRFLAEVQPALAAWWAEGDGAIFEAALGLSQELGTKLLYRGAYAEAKALLDPVVAQHVAPTKTLRGRWECRLYLGDPLASDDLDRAAKLDSPEDAAYLGPLALFGGDVAARTIAGTSRVAAALLSRARGVDPCPDRAAPHATASVSVEDGAALLARAERLADHALALGAAREETTLAQARLEGSAQDRGLQAGCRGVRAMIHEAAGDHAAALADFRRARLLRIAGGLCWQSDDYGPEIRRLERGTTPVQPACFEPDWLCDEARTADERAAAILEWSAQPWRALPRSPSSSEGPIAYVLLQGAIAQGASLWRAARELGIDLGDRVGFASRALPYLDRWRDRRDARRLAALARNAHATAFLGLETSLQEAAPGDVRALFAWVQRLVAAEQLDTRTILGGLEGAPWRRLRACVAERADEHDRLRDLFDLLQGEGLDARAVVSLVRVYEPLLSANAGDGDFPDPRWTADAVSLEGLDADRVAPLLIAWTRSGQRIPAAWGMQTLHTRWLWPLYHVWSATHVTPFLEEVERGGLDNGKQPTRGELAVRRACLARLRSRSKAASG